jgi:hypothetical protein
LLKSFLSSATPDAGFGGDVDFVAPGIMNAFSFRCT